MTKPVPTSIIWQQLECPCEGWLFSESVAQIDQRSPFSPFLPDLYEATITYAYSAAEQ